MPKSREVNVAPEIRLLLTILDQAYNRKSWHGTNLRGSIRGLSMEQAAWRPTPGRHNIWELVVHAAYWKYAVWRRLTGSRRGSFPYQGSNWFERPHAATQAAWREDVVLLDRMHAELRRAVERLSVRDLDRKAAGRPTSHVFVVTGAAAHDLYHAGQIQVLKRLMREE
jgi:hypothetical protein